MKEMDCNNNEDHQNDDTKKCKKGFPKILLIAFLFLIFGAFSVLSLSSDDINEVCNVNGSVLYKNTTLDGNWSCATIPIGITTAYAEMYNYSANDTAWTFPIVAANTYYNLTGLDVNHNKGFTFTSAVQTGGGSYFTTTVDGTYRAMFSISFESTISDALYGVGVVKNFEIGDIRECYSRRWARKEQVGSISSSCFIDLTVGDTINIQVENEDNTRNILVHTANFNLMRIDD